MLVYRWYKTNDGRQLTPVERTPIVAERTLREDHATAKGLDFSCHRYATLHTLAAYLRQYGVEKLKPNFSN